MSSDTLNLIVGAIIGLVSSLVAVTVTNYFQSRRDDKRRRWELEDRQLERGLKVILSRAEQARRYMNLYFDVILGLENCEMVLVHTKSTSELAETVLRLKPLIEDTTKAHAGVLNLNDPELNTEVQEMIGLVRHEYDEAKALDERMRGPDPISAEVELARIREFFHRGNVLRVQILNRIDQISLSTTLAGATIAGSASGPDLAVNGPVPRPNP